MTPSPYETARDLYQKQGMDFQADLEYYGRHGYIFSTPQFFLMGERHEDCWHIQCAVGKNCFRIWAERFMPYPLPFISWARFAKGRKTVKHYSLERILKLI